MKLIDLITPEELRREILNTDHTEQDVMAIAREMQPFTVALMPLFSNGRDFAHCYATLGAINEVLKKKVIQ